VSDPVLYDPTTKNFDAEVRKVAAFQPDAIVLVAFDESAALLRKLIESKLGPKEVKIYAGTGTKNATLAKQVNPNDAASVQGLRGVNPAATSNADFLRRLKAKVPSLSVTQYTGESYDCATLGRSLRSRPRARIRRPYATTWSRFRAMKSAPPLLTARSCWMLVKILITMG
jgi:ABC-type branched-subunit amino acid transport system substrate-binding protein